MIDDVAKAHLHDHLRWIREAVMLHYLSDTTRHAGHADILREGLDGAVGVDPEGPPRYGRDEAFWEARRATIERAAGGSDGGPWASRPG